jgi:hypothetical protein
MMFVSYYFQSFFFLVLFLVNAFARRRRNAKCTGTERERERERERCGRAREARTNERERREKGQKGQFSACSRRDSFIDSFANRIDYISKERARKKHKQRKIYCAINTRLDLQAVLSITRTVFRHGDKYSTYVRISHQFR